MNARFVLKFIQSCPSRFIATVETRLEIKPRLGGSEDPEPSNGDWCNAGEFHYLHNVIAVAAAGRKPGFN